MIWDGISRGECGGAGGKNGKRVCWREREATAALVTVMRRMCAQRASYEFSFSSMATSPSPPRKGSRPPTLLTHTFF